ncbi:MAG: GGDEF domain-containing protein [Desulfuromonadales bacterium]|nr:GGDEF domain-containing protein [Desulfuromonadales bacterium]
MKLTPWLYKQILDQLGEAVYFVDRERRILYWNRGAEQLTGFAAAEVAGRCCQDNLLEHVDAQMRPLCQDACPLAQAMETGESREERIFLRQKDGRRLPVEVKVAPIRDQRGKIVGAVEVFADASTFVQVEQLNHDLQRLVNIDQLTQLPNRRAILNALEREMERFSRYHTTFSLIFVDLDHFKLVNDRFGHLIGDQTLAWVAGRLRSLLRRVDMVGRYGGEEFVLLLPATRAGDACILAENLREQTAAEPCPATGETVSLSLGITEVRQHDTVVEILERADRAMYEAKRQGRNRVCLL